MWGIGTVLRENVQNSRNSLVNGAVMICLAVHYNNYTESEM